MPASARRRVVRVLVDAGLIIALCAVTERCCGILFAVGAVVLLIVVMTAMMAMTGATPGGLVTGVRLRKVVDPNGSPGRSAVIYVAFLVLSLVATAGLPPCFVDPLTMACLNSAPGSIDCRNGPPQCQADLGVDLLPSG